MISTIPVTSAQTLAEAYAVLAARPRGLRVLAGGTDLMVQLNARVGLERLGHVLDIWKLRELRFIDRRGDALRLGALATYTDLMRSPLVRACLPALADVSREVGAWAIQNRGTIGGNVCNASPAGDTLPILVAAGATFVLGGPRGERRVPAEEFFVAYRKTALGADELLLRVELPVLAPAERLVYRKVGTRKAQSISRTLLAVRATAAEGKLSGLRVAAGCVAPIPLRCAATEAAIEGRAIDPGTLAAARVALLSEVRPISDVRASAEYRAHVSANVLERLLRDLAG
ncbi:MAG TPA: xanthine dehydrogenase family protein subunit M [Myxococcales bacterium]|nr:xanthine dehydrogenase family protein subunit M [Myxococcales bacterium]